MLECALDNKEWNAKLTVDTVGIGKLQLQKMGGSGLHLCDIKIDYFADNQRAVVPQIVLEYSLQECVPVLGDLGKEVFEKGTLLVNINDIKNPTGLLQWLKFKQPDSCKVTKLSMFDISMNSKKWIEGKWGNKRSTASDDKKKK